MGIISARYIKAPLTDAKVRLPWGINNEEGQNKYLVADKPLVDDMETEKMEARALKISYLAKDRNNYKIV